MATDERRRLALHQAAAGTWGEEVADTLAELMRSQGEDLATRADIARLEQRIAGLEQRWEERIAALDQRWDERLLAQDQRMEAMEHRITAAFERRIADAVSTQTRTLVFSQLGALVVIAALAFGLR